MLPVGLQIVADERQQFNIVPCQDTREENVPVVPVVSNSVFELEQHVFLGTWHNMKQSARKREIKRSRPVSITIEIDECTVSVM